MYLTLAVVQVLLTSLLAQVDWVTTAHSTTHSTISMEARVSQILNQESLLRLELERKIHALETQVESLQSTSQDDKRTIANLTAALSTRKEPSVAFLVHLSHNIPTHPGPVVFDSAYLNVGNAFNTHNGIFTAPVTGIYSFSLTLSGDNGDVHGYIKQNGHNTGYVFADDMGSNKYQRASLSITLHCNKADRVWFDCIDNGNQKIYGSVNTWFSGHLVHMDQ
ncbi:hypothetical protein FSP39_009513 [Pinctada imbricata]|uniref:C1q domain-containing protein n=1 Tax=Pinctada imbricata TaxID=66713 RepID=A0AA88XU40_PINIB|nr:hypothetical protein FSP39_009513 [Pinctada imbricata]